TLPAGRLGPWAAPRYGIATVRLLCSTLEPRAASLEPPQHDSFVLAKMAPMDCLSRLALPPLCRDHRRARGLHRVLWRGRDPARSTAQGGESDRPQRTASYPLGFAQAGVR